MRPNRGRIPHRESGRVSLDRRVAPRLRGALRTRAGGASAQWGRVGGAEWVDRDVASSAFLGDWGRWEKPRGHDRPELHDAGATRDADGNTGPAPTLATAERPPGRVLRGPDVPGGWSRRDTDVHPPTARGRGLGRNPAAEHRPGR